MRSPFSMSGSEVLPEVVDPEDTVTFVFVVPEGNVADVEAVVPRLEVVPFGDVVTVVVVTEPLDVPLSQEAKKTVHIHIIRKKDNIFFIPRLLVILFWGKYII